ADPRGVSPHSLPNRRSRAGGLLSRRVAEMVSVPSGRSSSDPRTLDGPAPRRLARRPPSTRPGGALPPPAQPRPVAFTPLRRQTGRPPFRAGWRITLKPIARPGAVQGVRPGNRGEDQATW